MFGWSMFFGVLGAIAFLTAGALLVEYFYFRKGEQKKKPLPYFATLPVASGVIGLFLFGVSYYNFYWHFAGKITTIGWLNPKMIYRVGGQASIEEQNVVFLGNAKKDVWCVNSEPIDPKVGFVRVVKSPPPESKWILEPLNMPQQTPKE